MGWAHPRVCGENKELEFYEPAQLGSSPRVQGKPCLRRPGRRTHRLIPACAGKTLALWRFRASFRAHPRVCGENHYRVSVDCNRRGSSPRVRGKLNVWQNLQARVGLIPACAGKTPWRLRTLNRVAAHPRVCGENVDALRRAGWGIGSSPRVRGKPVSKTALKGRNGLIPACAGKTSGFRVSVGPSRAHPRVCGENNGNYDG